MAPDAGGPDGIPSRPEWSWIALLFAATVLFYLPTLPFGFSGLDDPTYIRDNPYIRTLSPSLAAEIFSTDYFANYHPLTILSYAIDFGFRGLRPELFRLQNILWHAGSVVLVGVLLRRWLRLGAYAWLLAFAWGMHPLRYESVVWISERKDTLVVFFYLLAFALHALGSRRSESRYARRVLPCEVASLALALLAKSMAVTYVAIAIAHDALLCPERLRRRAFAYAIFAALGLGFGIANVRAQERAIVKEPVSLPQRLALVANSTQYYATRTLVPFGLSPSHPFVSMPKMASLPVLGGAALLTALVAGAWRLRRTAPVPAFGIAFYLIALSPVSGIVPIGFSFVADRYSYLPSVGLLLAGGWCIARLAPARALALTIALAVPILLSNPNRQLGWWRDSASIWRRIAEAYPAYTHASLNIAQDRFGRAKGSVSPEEIESLPDQFGGDTRAQLLYAAYAESGEFAKAEDVLRSRMKDDRKRERGLAEVFSRAGRHAEAEQRIAALLRLATARPDDFALAANFHLGRGNTEKAEAALLAAPRPSLDLAQAMGQLSNVLVERGDVARAESWIERAERYDPAQYDVSRARSAMFAKAGADAAGMRHIERILTRPDVPLETMRFLLGMYGFFAERTGDTREALAAYRLALDYGMTDAVALRNAAALAGEVGEQTLQRRLLVRIEALGIAPK